MHEKDNYLKNAELSTEQNCNMIDGIPNTVAAPCSKTDGIDIGAKSTFLNRVKNFFLCFL